MRFLYHFFQTPSAFHKDPAGYAFNQIGHTLLVGSLPAYFFPGLVPLLLFGYAVWELGQVIVHDAEPWDGVQDWAFVCGGAIAVWHPVVLVPLGAYALSGVMRRWPS